MEKQALTLVKQSFELDDHEFRVVTINGEPWWFASDVADYFSYAPKSLVTMLRGQWSDELDEGVDFRKLEGQAFESFREIAVDLKSVSNMTRSVLLLSESGIHTVGMLSRKPRARRLRRWLAREVIPSIRRTGQYTRSESQPEMTTFSCVAPEFKAALELAQLFGLEGNQAILAASKAFTREYGVNPQQLIGLTQLVAPQQEELLTATELGKRTDVSRNSVNPLLEGLGLLTGYRDRRNKLQWVLTTKGKEFGVYLDVGKDRSNGTPIQQIKWYASIIDFIDAACNSDEIDFENWRKRS